MTSCYMLHATCYMLHATRYMHATEGSIVQGGSSFRILVRSTLPDWAVRDAGAPAEVWLDIQSAASSDALTYHVIWVNKTATRLPEVNLFTHTAGPRSLLTWSIPQESGHDATAISS